MIEPFDDDDYTTEDIDDELDDIADDIYDDYDDDKQQLKDFPANNF